MTTMTVQIRKLTFSDIETADRIIQAAFLSPERRGEELKRCLRLQPDGWRLAEREGHPVGMVGAVDYGPFAWIGYMAVLPEMQKQGIGRALMASILAWLDERGCPMARLDASDAGAILYEKIGFEAKGRTLLFVQEEPAVIKTPQVCVCHIEVEDIPAVADFDEPLFGARREELIKILQQDFPRRAFLARDESGQVSGFLFAQPRKIGPWAAKSAEDARALLGKALELAYQGAPRVILPAENLAAAELLTWSGFVQKQSHLHMCRGGLTLPGDRRLLFGQTSYGLG